MELSYILQEKYNVTIKTATNEQIYYALAFLINQKTKNTKSKPTKKKLYYLSAEFLIGRLLGSALVNLGLYESVAKELCENGKDIADIEELENEPSLCNGGLGRLAACFMDSAAALKLNAEGVGLLYHFGLFRQVFENNAQTAKPDKWLSDKSFLAKTDTTYPVEIGGKMLMARQYQIDVIGDSNYKNKLTLFDLESIDEKIVADGIEFDKQDISQNLTLFLYPDDSDENGRLLRVYQQYFMTSAAAQYIIDDCVKRGCKLSDLHEYAVVQINDTHPTMIIPELIRLLCEKGTDLDDAINTVSKTCAYTNHTILAEALEKWHISMIKKAAPKLLPYIEILDSRVRRKCCDEKTFIIDSNDMVHMANIDLHVCFAVNGVAKLHTELLKTTELSEFSKLYPHKFHNKTNGISFRRWLCLSNPRLAKLIESLVGSSYLENAESLKVLLKYINDEKVLSQLVSIKQENKQKLSQYLFKKQGIHLPEAFLFDIQIKRLHEYKRQQLNALSVISMYLDILSGKIPKTPVCVIFGGKAAPAYTIAQDIIHLILCLSQLVNGDEAVSRYLRVVMVENYNVSWAQKLIPACDISQQISLASKEASGTGNMKLMLSGAITIGTLDGANVEIAELVGRENIYIFGDDSETVVNRYKDKSYQPQKYYDENKKLRDAVNFITSEKMLAIGDRNRLRRLKNELLTKDWFMTFPDFDEYMKTREKAYADYFEGQSWSQKMLVNIANAGYFSSDRTIKEYNADVWKLN
ncbi:MAG: glycogen/starch/alpha-glucan family phosphorylase [Oscillospiraceae bacterium]|nr:glycogen/starch/alpha-glucan family phosphorylase [Oscillospiraceae bacterium]